MALDGLPTHSRVQVKVGLFSFMLGVAVSCLAGLVYFNECARDAFDFMTSFMLCVAKQSLLKQELFFCFWQSDFSLSLD